jgi:hypothetical protein
VAFPRAGQEVAVSTPIPDPARDLLRHAVATLAYRAAKVVRGAPDRFGEFRVGPTSRTPVEILAHIGDLLDWGLSLARGEHVWKDSAPLPWDGEVERFFDAIAALDGYLASGGALGFPPGRIFQGPVADALTHVGQIAMLRRLAGEPVRGENYFRAEIASGRVGPSQPAPMREFD